MTKQCSKCKQTKNITEVGKRSREADGHHTWCKVCKNIFETQYLIKHRAEVYSRKKEYRKQNPQKYKSYRRKAHLKRYRLSKEAYDSMYMEQLGLCAICHEPFGLHQPRIDHCHKTDKIRGLVHSSCNLMIGHAHERADLLELGIEYLRKHNGN